MDPSSIGAGLATLRQHLPVFLICMAGLPVLSFLTLKLWVARSATKVQRSTNWFVPDDLESETARVHYGMRGQSVAFSNRERVSR